MNDVEAKFPQFTVLITAFLQTLIIQPIKDSFYYMWSVSIIVPDFTVTLHCFMLTNHQTMVQKFNICKKTSFSSITSKLKISRCSKYVFKLKGCENKSLLYAKHLPERYKI